MKVSEVVKKSSKKKKRDRIDKRTNHYQSWKNDINEVLEKEEIKNLELEHKRCKKEYENLSYHKKLVVDLVTSKNYLQASSVLDKIDETPGFEWVVMGNKYNLGVANISTNPLRALVERIVNGGEANIDLLYFLRHGKFDPNNQKYENPISAAQDLLNFSELPEPHRSFFEKYHSGLGHDYGGRLLRIMHYESMIEVADCGIGMNADEFKNCFLTYHGQSDKGSKKHLGGKFHQGSLASLSFCGKNGRSGASVYSRKFDSDICVASYMRNMPGERHDKMSTYKYLVFEGEIVEVPARAIIYAENKSLPKTIREDVRLMHTYSYEMTDENFPHGTRIKHYDYSELENYNTITGAVTRSLYHTLNYLIPKPIVIGRVENRGNFSDLEELHKKGLTHTGHCVSRPITGLVRRLEGRSKKDISYKYNTTIRKSLSSLDSYYTIDAYVLDAGKKKNSNKDAADATEFFVDMRQPMVIHDYGQSHDSRGINKIKDDAGVSEVNLIISVDVSNLSADDKFELLAATRENARDGKELRSILTSLETLLTEDEEIQKLQAHAVAKKISSASVKTNETLKKFLSKIRKGMNGRFVGVIGRKGGVGGDGGNGGGGGGGGRRKSKRDKKEEIKTTDFPTFIKWENKKELLGFIGMDRGARFETNASDSFHNLDPKESCLSFKVISGNDIIEIDGATALRKGRGSISFKCIKNGEATIRAELYPNKNRILFEMIDSDDIVVKVSKKKNDTDITRNRTPKEDSNGGGNGIGNYESIPDVVINWVNSHDDDWKNLDHKGKHEASYKAIWESKKRSRIIITINEENYEYQMAYNGFKSQKWKDSFKESVASSLTFKVINDLTLDHDYNDESCYEQSKNRDCYVRMLDAIGWAIDRTGLAYELETAKKRKQY